jgi:hypothetical protein
MKRVLLVCIAALVTATFLAEDAAARNGVRRPRVVIYARPRYAPEPGTIYGYAPGNYLLGRNGILYGPYPLNPYAPIADLRY